MELFADITLTWPQAIMLVVALCIALGFEFVNGFHDTANAVATVIYTRALPARAAVVLAGLCNFIGVTIGGIAVAYSIVHLLPVDLLVDVNTARGMAMIFALLLAAVLWNLGTWLLGLPASSSHTLIGSVIGVGLANALREGLPLSAGVNWDKAMEVGASLLISPVIGFLAAALVIRLLRRLPAADAMSVAPTGDAPPPFWTRFSLVLSCLGVSLAHGSNDGQKGVGLILLILIGILPAQFALNLQASPAVVADAREAASHLADYYARHQERVAETVAAQGYDLPSGRRSGFPVTCGLANAAASASEVQRLTSEIVSFRALPDAARWRLRSEILCLADATSRVVEKAPIDRSEREALSTWLAQVRAPTEYAPRFVIVAVSLALGLGTMIGWKRIAVTIGEKIGHSPMTYAQGASAQIVAMATIGLADGLGMPVSTTHVLSSGVAGAMNASGGKLQRGTLKMAWVLTFPAALLVAMGLYFLAVAVTG